MAKVGDVYKWDFQSDIFQGEYRLVEDLGGGKFVAENMEPSDELIDEVVAYYLDESVNVYTGYFDPWGPNRRVATRQEALDEEIMNRIERTGRTFTIQMISRSAWAEMF